MVNSIRFTNIITICFSNFPSLPPALHPSLSYNEIRFYLPSTRPTTSCTARDSRRGSTPPSMPCAPTPTSSSTRSPAGFTLTSCSPIACWCSSSFGACWPWAARAVNCTFTGNCCVGACFLVCSLYFLLPSLLLPCCITALLFFISYW